MGILFEIEKFIQSQPYLCCCAVCGGELELLKRVDKDMDLTLEVEPCKDCIENALAEAKEEAERDRKKKLENGAKPEIKDKCDDDCYCRPLHLECPPQGR